MRQDIPLLVQGQSVRNTPRHSRRRTQTCPVSKLSIIIPCYNEAGTISEILDKILDVQFHQNIDKEIIVVDDCSTDDTELMISEYIDDNPTAPICYICHRINQGKGSAIHTGLAHVTGDYILIQDADLEYDPVDYNRLLEPILNGHADIVYGSRFMGGRPHRILFFWHTLGNKLLTFISNLCTNRHLTDAHTCYKLVKSDILRSLHLSERRFAFDAELNVKLARLQHLRIYEVGISYYGRTFRDGKKIRLKDAFRTFFCLIKYTLLKTK